MASSLRRLIGRGLAAASARSCCDFGARHGQQVVADKRIFDGPRHVGGKARSTARQGAADSASGTATQRCGRRCTPLQCT